LIRPTKQYLIRRTDHYPINPLNANLNPICHLLALLAAHPILHISRIRVKYVVFSIPQSPRPSYDQISYLAHYSQTPSACVRSSMLQTKIHTQFRVS
jgi:hypothetical protein